MNILGWMEFTFSTWSGWLIPALNKGKAKPPALPARSGRDSQNEAGGPNPPAPITTTMPNDLTVCRQRRRLP
ncbi:MAG: hypothetical protein DME65_15450 [Verrucomicrobia bacterium]|nr:MAG: hypothetical protein DME65_15450 [Verrucomicrobiota bacterium]